MREVVIATRKSALAMWQALHVQRKLQAIRPQWNITLLGMVTRGDVLLDSPLSKIGGKGLFVKELELSIQERKADLAVHSMKDVPMCLPDGFVLSSILERENPSDAFVSNDYATLEDLPAGAVVGTSSLRRQCQLLRQRPDLKVKSLRGNVQTRLRKLDEEEFAAIILATAGLLRLELAERIAQEISSDILLPACGQGAVGIESRADDQALNEALLELNHTDTAAVVGAERAMNRKLNGGCQVPIAGFAQLDKGVLRMEGRVGAEDGSELLVAFGQGPSAEAERIGEEVAMQLLAQGAQRLLDQIRA